MSLANISAIHQLTCAAISLERIPGEFIGAASRSLPDPTAPTDSRDSVVVNIPRLGRVQLFYERASSRRGKGRASWWQVRGAERMKIAVPVVDIVTH